MEFQLQKNLKETDRRQEENLLNKIIKTMKVNKTTRMKAIFHKNALNLIVVESCM